MGTFDLIKQIQQSEQFGNVSFEKKVAINQQLADIATQDDVYASLDFEAQDIIRKRILSTMPGYDPASIVGEGAEYDRQRSLLAQAESIKTGQADINAWDGIIETGRDYLSGKLTAGLADIFVEGDLTEGIFGDRGQELETYRDYLAEVNDPEGMTDYKVGKVFGHILGFGTDALAMSLLYGGVGAPGLIQQTGARLLGANVATKTFTHAMTKGGKLLNYLPRLAGQMGFEATGYVAETAIADAITGQLDTDTEFNEYLKTIPSTFAQGLVYTALGESIGAGVGNALKGVSKVWTAKGFRETTIKEVMEKTTPAIRDSFLDVLQNGTISEANLQSLRSVKVSSDFIDKLQSSALNSKLVLDTKSLSNNPDELRKVAWKALYGMDIEYQGDSIKVLSYGGEKLKNPEFIGSDSDFRNFLVNQSNDNLNSIWQESRKFAASRKGDLELEVTTRTGQNAIKADEVLPLFGINERYITSVKKPEDFDNLAKSLLGEESGIEIKGVEDYFKIALPQKRGVIFIPEKVNTPEQAQRFTQDFFDQISKNSDGRLKFNSEALGSSFRPASHIKYNKKFLTDTIGLANFKIQPDDTVKYALPGVTGEPKIANNIHQAGRDVHMTLTNLKEHHAVLLRDRGIKIDLKDNNIDITYPNGKKETVAGIEELFDNPMTRPDLPFSERDTFIWATKDVTDIQSIGEGTIDQLKMRAKEYTKDGNFVKNVFEDATKRIVDDPVFTTFKVISKETGFTREFDSLSKAKAWLSTGKTKYEALQETLMERGWKLEPAKGGGYVAQSPGKDPVFAKNFRDLEAKVADFEDIYNVPDMLDHLQIDDFKIGARIADEAYGQIQAEVVKLGRIQDKAQGFGAGRFKQTIDKLFKPMRERIEATGNKVLIESFDKLHVANRVFNSKYMEGKVMIDSLFHGKGRKFSFEELTQMGDLLRIETNPANWSTAAGITGIKFTPKMEEAMSITRQAMDVLGAKFSIDPADWINNYWPRLAKMKQNEFSEMIATKRKNIGDEWFKHLRTEDYLSTQFENNIENILELYMRAGYRELYLGNVIDEVAKLTTEKGAVDKLGQEGLKLIEDANEKVIGRVYSSDKARQITDRILTNQAHARKRLEEMGDLKGWDQATRAQKAREQLNVDWTRYASDLSTSALMAFKMKMPLRNVSQVYTILGPMAGPDTVFTASRQLGNTDFATAFYKELYDKGIIKPRQGQTYEHSKIWNTIKNWNQVGMTNFYHSDDYTRMVSSLSARDVFRNAWELVRTGEQNIDYFMKATKTDYLNPADKIKFLELITAKDLSGAETLLQRRWTDITMFDYDQMNKPEMLNSGLGKIFGQFSTYPFSYTQFVKRGLKAEGAIFTAKLLMATTAMAAFYGDILGIDNAISANPLNTMFFAGGPMLRTGMGAIEDVSRLARDPSVSKATAVFDGFKRIAVPYYGISNSVLKSIDNYNEGDFHAGTINLLGASLSESNLFN